RVTERECTTELRPEPGSRYQQHDESEDIYFREPEIPDLFLVGVCGGFLSCQYWRRMPSCIMAKSHPARVAGDQVEGGSLTSRPLPRAGSELEHLVSGPRITLAPSAAGRTMARCLSWVSHQRLTGWACSQCGWTFPV